MKRKRMLKVITEYSHSVVITAGCKQIRKHWIPSDVGDRCVVAFEDFEQAPCILVPDIHVGV